MMSCSTSKQETAVYFGGKIINPKEKYVVLLQNEEVIDTLFLNEDNRFFKKYENLDENLYTFKHGIEFQYIYLQPTDSVLVHLNTWDFDESLVFSGRGSYKNEFLLDLFLHDEQILSKINSYFSEEETVFENQIEALNQERLKIYEKFLKNDETISEKYKKTVFVAINYPVYRLKELYPLYYYNIHHKFPEISKNYYAFRKEVDFNTDVLTGFYSYHSYVIAYVYNIGYLKSQIQPKVPITQHFLNTVVENISSEALRNDLLFRFTITDVFDNKPYCSSNKETLKLFFSNCTDKKSTNQLQKIINDCKKLPLSEEMPNFAIKNYQNQYLSIKNVIYRKNAILYFWSTKTASAQYLVNRLHFLENQFPNILFIGINTDPNFNIYKSDKGYLKLSLQRQYKLPKNSKAFSFLTSEFSKVIMVDKKRKITHHFLSLNATNLNQELQIFKNNQ